MSWICGVCHRCEGRETGVGIHGVGRNCKGSKMGGVDERRRRGAEALADTVGEDEK